MYGLISIDYDEYNQGSYRAVKAKPQGDAPFENFATGAVCTDFAAGLAWLREQGCKEVVYMSSVDAFLMDGDQYHYDSDNRIAPGPRTDYTLSAEPDEDDDYPLLNMRTKL